MVTRNGTQGEGIFSEGWNGGTGVVGTGSKWHLDSDQDTWIGSDEDDKLQTVVGEVEVAEWTVGTEIITNAEAGANRDDTEADAVTNWNALTAGGAITSYSADPYRGAYAVRMVASGDGHGMSIGFAVVAGVRYQVSVRAKVIAGGAGALTIDTSATIGGADILTIASPFSATEWTRYTGFWTAAATATVYFQALESSGTDDADILVDDLSVKTAGLLTVQGSVTIKDDLIIDDVIYIGETANTNMTTGLTINQGAADNQVVAFKSSDVAHAMTNTVEADTFGEITKGEAAAGGLNIRGFKDADGVAGQALLLQGILGETADTTKTTAAKGIIQFGAQVTDGGSGATTVGADGNLCVWYNHANARFIFDAEGSGHADVEWTTYDTYDDLALINDMESELLLSEDAAKTDRRHMLEEAGIIGEDSWHMERGKPRAMVNFTKLAMLHHGSLIQVRDRFTRLEAALETAGIALPEAT